ncbi:hypothetical protein ETAA8_54060 [Anatilimnocola aggregata]|uniref:HTH HARE-type domain-containing protein n=1 Tax=Anatilimnocola aggregata TaxID=2528021 RepID=A0A517YJ80_9BACT|nr:HTH domain-containing protein [Anatilimnocola aggregata]QDU30287.1 hypothetical protein ETAA8_54060 [Anatilimnocola aggregata]
MSTKKATKSKSAKSPKSAASKKSKTPAKPSARAKAVEVQQPASTAGTCPKGGDHEWAEENEENFCSKCKEPKAGKPAKIKRSIAARPVGEKKVSAIDAAAKLLGDVGTPMNCIEMIEAMASKGLWESPGGKTPHATLYSAIIREIGLKGQASRFVKSERGRFTIKA